MTNPPRRGRPPLMKNPTRIIVQLEQSDYTKLVALLDVSVAQFVRDAVTQKLAGQPS
jgi:hypothetical protein